MPVRPWAQVADGSDQHYAKLAATGCTISGMPEHCFLSLWRYLYDYRPQ
ncbi:MAG: hypothetical protein LBE78_02205 [Burkholderiaceae bacterium]|jgi:hypothetical protein|nr:hypothetical protein [Burkholderiaceae bacterium]